MLFWSCNKAFYRGQLVSKKIGFHVPRRLLLMQCCNIKVLLFPLSLFFTVLYSGAIKSCCHCFRLLLFCMRLRKSVQLMACHLSTFVITSVTGKGLICTKMFSTPDWNAYDKQGNMKFIRWLILDLPFLSKFLMEFARKIDSLSQCVSRLTGICTCKFCFIMNHLLTQHTCMRDQYCLSKLVWFSIKQTFLRNTRACETNSIKMPNATEFFDVTISKNKRLSEIVNWGCVMIL